MFWQAWQSSGDTNYRTLAVSLPSVLYFLFPVNGQASRNILH